MKSIFCVLLVLLAGVTGLNAQNNAPSATPDVAVCFEEVPFPLFPLNNDSDPDGDSLSWTAVLGPFNGTLSTTSQGYILYTGNHNFFGTDIIFYKVCDNGIPSKCAYSTIIITVNNVTDPPVAENDTFTMNEDATLNMNVLANDQNPDKVNLVINRIDQGPTHGTGTITPQQNRIVYKPNANYNGYDQLRYRMCDTSGFFPLCVQAKVLIIIKPVDDAPVAHADTIIDNPTDETPVITNLLHNDTDIEGDTLHIGGIIPGKGVSDSAVFSYDSLGNIILVSSPCGVDSFYYLSCDAHLCDTGIVYLIVVCPPPAPDSVEAIFLPEGFSPNGDGHNDFLVFKGLVAARQPSVLKVFNRYGSIVYQSENYQNDWDGNDQDNHKPIPDGTYYYTLRLPDGMSHANYLMIVR